MISSVSRMPEQGTSGLMSGGEETWPWERLRHRHMAKAVGKPLLPQPTAGRASPRLYFWGRTGILRKSRGQRRIPGDSTCQLHGNTPAGIDLQQFEGAALYLRPGRQQREGMVRTARQGHLVQRQRGQVGEKGREAVDQQPVGGAFSVSLCCCISLWVRSEFPD